MADRGGAVLRHMHALFNVGTVAGLTDGELLERFTTRGSEAAELAFAALVERHGPMVLRVCRRILSDPDDAQDAFQATFLVLVRRARSIRKRESVASWLYGVAYRVASCARMAEARRREIERRYAEAEAQPVVHRDGELGPVLHEEMDRLPESYRAPIVLCYLEGLSHEQAAWQLGWPVGTVKSRLARGRERLQRRLTRRGLAPSAGLAVALSKESASAAIAPALADSTVGAARRLAAGRAAAGIVSAATANLMQGVLKKMLMTTFRKTAGAVVAFGILAAGAGVLAQQLTESSVPLPPVNAPEQSCPMFTYEVRILNMKGIDWRGDFDDRLKRVAREASTTAWTTDERRTISDLLAWCTNRGGNFLQTPKVSAYEDAPCTVLNETKKNYIGGLKRCGPAEKPDGFRPEVETIGDGTRVNMTGHAVPRGVLIRGVLEDTRLVAFHTTRMALLEAPRGGQVRVEGESDSKRSAAIAPASSEERHGLLRLAGCLANPLPFGLPLLGLPLLKSDGRPGAGQVYGTIQVPEVVKGKLEGEWLIPHEGALVVSLGVQKVIDAQGKSVVQERLVLIQARPVSSKAQTDPPTADNAKDRRGVSRPDAKSEGLGDRP